MILCTAAVLLAGFLTLSFLPKDDTSSGHGQLRIGAGDDISGYLMAETLKLCDNVTAEDQAVIESFEFNDC